MLVPPVDATHHLAAARKSLARNRKSCTGVAATKERVTLASRQGGGQRCLLLLLVPNRAGQANSGRASRPASFRGRRPLVGRESYARAPPERSALKRAFCSSVSMS